MNIIFFYKGGIELAGFNPEGEGASKMREKGN